MATKTVTLLSRHQLSALIATGVDYAVMIVCVSLAGLTPVVGTVLGALFGGITSFTLGRRWVFPRHTGALLGQSLRYALVSSVSLLGNAAGEWLLLRTSLHYIAARVVASTLVGVGWNFPMQRHFVFKASRE